MATLDKLKQLVAEILEVPEDMIKPESRFKEDLGADSLSLVEMAMELEEKYGISISDEVAEKFITVQDVIDYLSKEGKIEQG
jgi:acyl carrier protein